MSVTTASFRQSFPEFASGNTYPNSAVDYWLSIAVIMLPAARWLTLLDHGVSMFVAHNLVLEARGLASSANGGLPGGDVGPVNNKSVDKVSVGYDTNSGIVADAGHWNLTHFGTRFIALARTIGAGPIQIGAPVGCSGGDPNLQSCNAWSGPWPWQFPNMNE